MCKRCVIHDQNCWITGQLSGYAAAWQVQCCTGLDTAIPVAHGDFTWDAKLLSCFDESARSDIPGANDATSQTIAAVADDTSLGRRSASVPYSNEPKRPPMPTMPVCSCSKSRHIKHEGLHSSELKPHAYLKSPQTFKLSWLPFNMYTAPPCNLACWSSCRNNLKMPAGTHNPKVHYSIH